jgi:hypothetical protein
MRLYAHFRPCALLVLLLLARTDLPACSCLRIGPACEAAWQVDTVFVGKVDRIEPFTIFGVPLAWPFPTQRSVTFAVKESFRGPRDKMIVVKTGMGGGDCGIDFQRGRDYLVYAYRDKVTRTLYTGVCTRTTYAENASNDLLYLRSLTGNPPPARVYGFVTANAWDRRFGEKATKPLAAVPVYLKSEGRQWRTLTDGAGSFDFSMLPAGRFLLSAALPGELGGGAPREIFLGEHACSQQILVVFEQGALSGRVFDNAGNPLQTNVVMAPVAGDRFTKADAGFSAADGAFTIRNVASGDYFLGVNLSDPPRAGLGLNTPWQPTYYPGVQDRALATPIHINRAQQLQGFEFRLPPPLRQRTITGVVEFPNGKPAQAFVELKDDAFEGNVDLGNSGRDGTFTVTGVVDRPYSISAVIGVGEGEVPMHSTKIKLAPSSNGPIRLVLSFPGRN